MQDGYMHMIPNSAAGIGTLPFKMFGRGQKVLSRLAWSKFWPILANQ